MDRENAGERFLRFVLPIVFLLLSSATQPAFEPLGNRHRRVRGGRTRARRQHLDGPGDAVPRRPSPQQPSHVLLACGGTRRTARTPGRRTIASCLPRRTRTVPILETTPVY